MDHSSNCMDNTLQFGEVLSMAEQIKARTERLKNIYEHIEANETVYETDTLLKETLRMFQCISELQDQISPAFSPEDQLARSETFDEKLMEGFDVKFLNDHSFRVVLPFIPFKGSSSWKKKYAKFFYGPLGG